MGLLAFDGRRRAFWVGRSQFALPTIGIGVTMAIVLVPLLTLILFSFREGSPWAPGALTLDNYIRAYSNTQTYTIFLNTAVLATFSTAISVAIAIFFAFLTERTDMPFRNVAWGLLLVPMAMPGLLFAVSWTFLLSPNNGTINVWLRELIGLFGVEVRRGPFNIYSFSGMVFLEGLRGVTTTFLIMVGAFRAMDPSLEEAARISGGSNRTTFFRVTLPMLTPAIMAAGMYSFMTHLESLEIPIIIGLPARIFVFPSYIFFTTQRFVPPQYGLSAALGATFLVVSIVLVWWYRRVLSRTGRFATVTGKGYRPRIIALGKWRNICFGIFVVYFLATIGAPTLALLWASLLPVPQLPSFELFGQVSLNHYRAIFARPDIAKAVVNTIWVTLGAATLTMVLSLVVGWFVIRQKARGAAFVDAVSFLPHAIPGVVIGIALIFLVSQPPLNSLRLFGTIEIIIVGLTITYIAFGSRAMTGAMAQLHMDHEEAARTSGAKWRVVMQRIVLPLLLPAFISGWIWVASHALRNFSIPLMLAGRDNRVLSVILWRTWDDGSPGQTSALGVLLIVGLAIITVGGRWLVARVSLQQQG